MAKFDAARFRPGSEWAYRRRDDAPSERVRVLRVQATQNSGRADIEFLDDQETGRTETVPASRLRVPWDLVLSPVGSLLVAEAACRAAPMPVLDWVIDEERQIREKVKRGGRRTSVVEREEVDTSPEWEYHWYRARDRPLHELLRQWCGHRAVTFQERLTAAEAENHRLDVLVAELIDALRHAGSEHAAAAFEREHERDRATAPTARPVIDRPLEISEIPVRYLPARRSWSH